MKPSTCRGVEILRHPVHGDRIGRQILGHVDQDLGLAEIPSIRTPRGFTLGHPRVPTIDGGSPSRLFTGKQLTSLREIMTWLSKPGPTRQTAIGLLRRIGRAALPRPPTT